MLYLYDYLPLTFKVPSLCPFPFCLFLFSISFFGGLFIETPISEFCDKTVSLELPFQISQCLLDVVIVNLYLHASFTPFVARLGKLLL